MSAFRRHPDYAKTRALFEQRRGEFHTPQTYRSILRVLAASQRVRDTVDSIRRSIRQGPFFNDDDERPS